jgi:hypothetical protein
MIHKDIILYHFTSDKHIAGCLKDGLTKGVTYAGHDGYGVHFLDHTQWLTANSKFNQSWNQGSTLPYDRNANRLTICIPKEYTQNVVEWVSFGPSMVPATYKELSMFGDPENWYIYMGDVPPEWIIERTKKSD